MQTKFQFFLTIGVLGLCLLSCSLTPENKVPISVSIPKEFFEAVSLTPNGPPFAQFECFFVNITGPGIAPGIGSGYFGANPPVCIQPGILSEVKPLITVWPAHVDFNLAAPAGNDRNIQVLAFKSNYNGSGAEQCPYNNLRAYFHPEENEVTTAPPQIYQVGIANHVDFFQNTVITINKQYEYSYVNLVAQCPSRK